MITGSNVMLLKQSNISTSAGLSLTELVSKNWIVSYAVRNAHITATLNQQQRVVNPLHFAYRMQLEGN